MGQRCFDLCVIPDFKFCSRIFVSLLLPLLLFHLYVRKVANNAVMVSISFPELSQVVWNEHSSTYSTTFQVSATASNPSVYIPKFCSFGDITGSSSVSVTVPETPLVTIPQGASTTTSVTKCPLVSKALAPKRGSCVNSFCAFGGTCCEDSDMRACCPSMYLFCLFCVPH